MLCPRARHFIRCLVLVQSFSSECVSKIIFLISQAKQMLWVLKPKTYVKIDGYENINNCTLKNFVYLNLCSSIQEDLLNPKKIAIWTTMNALQTYVKCDLGRGGIFCGVTLLVSDQ